MAKTTGEKTAILRKVQTSSSKTWLRFARRETSAAFSNRRRPDQRVSIKIRDCCINVES